MGDGLGFLFLLDQEADPVKGGYVDEEHGDHTDGVEHGTAAHQVVQNVIGSAIATEQEHIVSVGENVGDKGGNTKEEQNTYFGRWMN